MAAFFLGTGGAPAPTYLKEYPLDLAVVQRYYAPRKSTPAPPPEETVEEAGPSTSTGGAGAGGTETDFESQQQALQVKGELMNMWAQQLDRDEATLDKLKLSKNRLQEFLTRAEQLELKSQANRDARRANDIAFDLAEFHEQDLVKLLSLNENRSTKVDLDHIDKLTKMGSEALQAETARLNAELEKLIANPTKYLKDNGLYGLTEVKEEDLDPIPITGRPITLEELKKYDPGLTDLADEIAAAAAKIGDGDQEPQLIIEKYNASFEVELQCEDGKPIVFTCYGATKEEAMEKGIREIKKVLLSPFMK